VPFFAAPNITATKVDSWDDTGTPDGKADPGQTITYTVTITNTGDANATGVTFTDSVDTNTTLVASSSVLAAGDNYTTIGNVQINVPTAQGLLANDRDVDAGNNTGITASGGTTSTAGGTVSISPDGSFTYDPPVGYNGTDTFTYTATTSGGKTATATARIVVAGKIWFVNNNAGACTSNCNGRLSHPLTSLANFQAVNDGGASHPAAGDNVFVYESATNYVGPVTFLANQRLIGQDATASLISLIGLTQPSGTDPLPATASANGTIVNITTTAPATNALTVSAGGVTLRGFTVGATTGAKIFGTSFGTLTVGNSGSPDVTLNGTGQALNLTTGNFAATSGFNGVTSTSSATQGIILTGVGGTVSFGSTSVSGATTQGILIGTTTADINFGNTTVSATTDAISFQNNSSGTRTFGTLTATGGAAGTAFLHGAGGGNVTVNGLATLASAAANTVDIQNQGASTTVNFAGGATLTKSAPANTGINLNTDNGNVTFGGTLTIGTSGARFPTTAVTINGGSTGVYSLGTVSIFTNGFAGISATNADGTLNVTGGTVDVNAASALNISGPAGITTLGITLGTLNSTGGTNNVLLTNTGGSVTVSGGAISGASGSSFAVSGGNPTVSFSPTITQNNAARAVDIQGTTGNTVTISGTVTAGASSLGVHIGDTSAVNGNVTFSTLNLGTAGARMTNAAVTITNGGSAATYTLGTFAIFTNNAKGIAALNFDGTLNCSSTSTVDSSNATAIDIDGPAGLTTLGMTLVSVNSAGGTADGISLQDTNGTFSVLGDNSNTAVGGNSTGGTISNKSGADNNNTQGVGVFLNNVTNITLRRVTINGTNQNFGIKGFSVNGFVLEYSTVGGTNGTAASLTTPENYGEGAVYFGNATANGTTGTVTITNNNINGGRKRNFSLVNTTAGTTTLTVKGNTFGAIQNFADGGSSFAVEARVATSGLTINTTLGGTNAGEPNTLTSAPGDLVNFTGQDGTTMDVVMRNNTLSDNHAFNNSGGGGIAFATKGTMTFHVTGNTMRDANGSAVTFFKAASGISTPSMSGFFDSNTIGVAAVNASGSKTGNGIFVSAGGTGTMSYTITNNQIHQIGGNSHIFADNTGGSYTANFDIRGNVLDTPVLPNWFGGIAITNGSPTSTDTINVCARIGGSAAADKNTFNLGAQLGVIVGVSGAAAGHTFNLPGYAGGASLVNVQNFIIGNNTMNGASVSAYNDPPATAAQFTGVGTGCGTPTSAPAPIPNGSRGTPGVAQPPATPTQTTATTSNNVTDRAFVSPRTTAPTVVAPQRTTTIARTAPTTNAAPTTRETLAPTINGAGGTVTVNIGTLAPGDSVTITFQVVIDAVYSGGPNVSNQGTVSGTNFTTVNGVSTSLPNTDDPDIAGAANPTLTPIAQTNIKVNNAKVAEPSTGTSQLIFTVSLSSPAGAGGVTVNYATANGGPTPATGGASCDGTTDYISASGPLVIPSGQKVATVPIVVCSDSNAEPDETLLLNISAPSSGTIIGAQATGTITAADTPGTLIISEFRTRGPAGANDDFVELYNNTNSSMNIAGYGVFKMGSGCAATPVLLATIPNDANAVVPAHGHYLLTGSAYSLADYGGTGAAAGNTPLTADIEDDVNLAVFSTANIVDISSANRLDAVGFGTNTGAVCDLLREGTTLAPVGALNIDYSYFRKQCDFVYNVGCTSNLYPKETNDNFADFMFADTQMTPISGIPTRLGAPGPENRSSPIRRDDSIVSVTLLDSSPGKTKDTPPNRERPTTSGDPNALQQFGTLAIRRRVDNTSVSTTITRLRFRIVEVTTGPTPPAGTADLRAIDTPSSIVISGITDPVTCAKTGNPTPPQPVPCSVTVQPTKLETVPTMTKGGGYNATMSVAIPGGLAPGASVDVNFTLGAMQAGSFRFYIIVEALP
jgi:hypothetical protein